MFFNSLLEHLLKHTCIDRQFSSAPILSAFNDVS
ncbi:MAG: hypothetical protein JWQ21_3882 [Herminiimonas sp.]|nr:hypothetical protein [Herminiimonas sp.]